METMTITLPTDLREFVERQVTCRGLASPSDFFQVLLDHERQAVDQKSRLESQLLEGLDEGATVTFTRDWWQQQQRDCQAEVNHKAAQ